VVCFDESPVQLIGEVRQPIPAEPGQFERYDCEYRRSQTPHQRNCRMGTTAKRRRRPHQMDVANRIAAGTDVDLGRVSLGVAVRAMAPKPDVSTVEAFKKVLLKAKAVAAPGSTSGIWLTTDLFPRLGIAEKINVKVTPRGTDATGMVAAGDADPCGHAGQ